MMTEAATIVFHDSQASCEAVVIVRCNEGHVALCLSLESNGDVEVVMKKDDALKLLEALKAAIG